MKILRYKVISLDVWGNKRDGYEVNAAHYTGEVIEIPESVMDGPDKAFYNYLRKIGFMKKGVITKFVDVDGEKDYTLNFS